MVYISRDFHLSSLKKKKETKEKIFFIIYYLLKINSIDLMNMVSNELNENQEFLLQQLLSSLLLLSLFVVMVLMDHFQLFPIHQDLKNTELE